MTGQGDNVAIDAVVFDLGGVLIDWDPRHLYRKLFPGDEAAMEGFLATVCTQEWNSRQDAGRSFTDGVAELTTRFPEHAALIAAYDTRWEEMIAGPIDGTLRLLEGLRRRQTPLFALTNWSADKFPVARRRFGFLAWFGGIVNSGEEGVIKPDPAIFRILIERHGVTPDTTLFIDDTAANVDAARGLGFQVHHFVLPEALGADLGRRGLLREAPARSLTRSRRWTTMIRYQARRLRKRAERSRP